MPRIPSLRRHKPTSQAVVTLSGNDHYLGVWPSQRKTPPPDIQAKYERLIAEWLANQRAPLPTKSRQQLQAEGNIGVSTPSPLTVAELILRYWHFAEGYYRHPDGTASPELHCLKSALRPLRKLYQDLPASEFTPLKLKAVRESMIGEGLARKTINSNIGRIKRLFKWADENELLPFGLAHSLAGVAGLKKGRTEAKEPEPIEPVAPEVVVQTLPHLPRTVAAMVQIQMLTGARSSEVCIMRPCDIDRTTDVWVYRPTKHKTAHHDKDRIIPLGPRAQAILEPFLAATSGPEDFVFSPVRAEAEREAKRSAARKTPRYPSHIRRNVTKRKPKPKRRPKSHYDHNSYARCITRACEKAFPLPPELERQRDPQTGRSECETAWQTRLGPERWQKIAEWRTQNHWHPHQLRHLKATQIRASHGLDAAQVILGHSDANVTQIYAKQELSKAIDIARITG